MPGPRRRGPRPGVATAAGTLSASAHRPLLWSPISHSEEISSDDAGESGKWTIEGKDEVFRSGRESIEGKEMFGGAGRAGG